MDGDNDPIEANSGKLVTFHPPRGKTIVTFPPPRGKTIVTFPTPRRKTIVIPFLHWLRGMVAS